MRSRGQSPILLVRSRGRRKRSGAAEASFQLEASSGDCGCKGRIVGDAAEEPPPPKPPPPPPKPPPVEKEKLFPRSGRIRNGCSFGRRARKPPRPCDPDCPACRGRHRPRTCGALANRRISPQQEEVPDGEEKEKKEGGGSLAGRRAIDALRIQCDECSKWRKLPSTMRGDPRLTKKWTCDLSESCGGETITCETEEEETNRPDAAPAADQERGVTFPGGGMAEGTGKHHGKTKGVKKACRPWVETWIESEDRRAFARRQGATCRCGTRGYA